VLVSEFRNSLVYSRAADMPEILEIYDKYGITFHV
jgi:hypothetical protein